MWGNGAGSIPILPAPFTDQIVYIMKKGLVKNTRNVQR